jgi:hypothetical protein
MNQIPTWLTLTAFVLSNVGAFYAGGHFVRQQLKKDPAKLEKLIADAKALRDKIRSRFD